MDIMMSMRDRGNTDRTKDKKISYLGGIPVRLVLVGRPRCKVLTPVAPRLTTGSKMLTLDLDTAADGEGGTPRSCAKHATARLHTRIRQRSSKRRRVLPKSFGSRRIRSGSRHVHLALACASRTGLSKTSPFDQMGRCSGQNGSTRRAN